VLTLFVGSNLRSTAANSAKETIKNLQDAFIGESTASAKYAAFAKKAREEGQDRIGLLFEAASKAESIHAGNHKAVLEQIGGAIPSLDLKFDVKSTKENLQNAIEGESYEVQTMYPDFLKKAQEEGVQLAMISFNYAYQTEKKHKELYQNALFALKNKTTANLSPVYSVCTVCGNTYDTKSPERCGICMTPKERFVQFTL
jgi:rubrerythrin